MTEITPFQFVEKYKLIPKKFRKKFTNSTKKISLIYDNDQDLNIFNNLIIILKWHQSCTSGTNYEKLKHGIDNEVWRWKSRVFNDVIIYLLESLKQKTIITYKNIIMFRKKQVINQINEIVSYRVGNPGYELAKTHFESLSLLY